MAWRHVREMTACPKCGAQKKRKCNGAARGEYHEERIAAHNAKLPTLNDLRGMAPNCTGGMASDEFIDMIRAESW